jgi:hypothetical protein
MEGHAAMDMSLAAVLVARFVRTGGIAMLRMMDGSPDGPVKHHANHVVNPNTTDEEHVRDRRRVQ